MSKRTSLQEEYPPFSVLMSVYKNEKPEYLDKALTSVEKQTVIPDEIVLVEDGPISNSLKQVIIKHKNFFGKGFKDIISSQNRGLGAALRLGTNYVSTNWIARMDSDDISVANRFELQLKEIQKQPSLALIGGQVLEFKNSTDNVIGERKVPLKKVDIYNFMKWRSPFNHPSVMINKAALNEVGGYIPYGNLEDYYLWVRIISNGYQVGNIGKILLYMRVDKGLYSRRGKYSNIAYFYKLHHYMYANQMMKLSEKIISNVIVTLNILLPNNIRKLVYQRILHH